VGGRRARGWRARGVSSSRGFCSFSDGRFARRFCAAAGPGPSRDLPLFERLALAWADSTQTGAWERTARRWQRHSNSLSKSGCLRGRRQECTMEKAAGLKRMSGQAAQGSRGNEAAVVGRGVAGYCAILIGARSTRACTEGDVLSRAVPCMCRHCIARMYLLGTECFPPPHLYL
jgi:hypothetical protein